MHGIWITWEKQRRNVSISSAIGFPLFEIIINKKRLSRYFISIYKTIEIIIKERPQILIVQNPSIVLAATTVLIKKIFGYFLVVDSHNSGIFPAEGNNDLLMLMSNLIQRFADLTIITNDEIASEVKKNGGRFFILPDRIPDIPEGLKIDKLKGRINLAFICTFSSDEPFNEVIDSAKYIPDDVYIYVTGKYQNKIDMNRVPNNVILMGFIPDDDYWSLLNSVDIVIDLTTRESCLVCGAYEGLALAKPMILSNTRITKSYFSNGAIYVDPNIESIAKGINESINCTVEMSNELVELKKRLSFQWEKLIIEFKDKYFKQ
jgi:glycosyltransferase involved in cell wall biosynthesis